MRAPSLRLAAACAAALLVAAAAAVWLSDTGSPDRPPRADRSQTRPEEQPRVTATTGFADIVPAPVRAQGAAGPNWTLTADTRIRTAPEAAAIGDYLAQLLRPATGFPIPVRPGTSGAESDITLVLDPGTPDAGRDGPEGYRLDIRATGVTARAAHPAGLFHAVQTLRQLLPAEIDSPRPVDSVWAVPAGTVEDRPRYAYRGLSLDIARHYFTPAEVRRFVDHLARYKFNHLHLHLTDDQGWRIAVDGWPRLTEVGAATQVGGGPGGFWTQDDYRAVVAYAAARHVTVVPEIDMPGHTNAALVAYPELGCDGRTYKPYTGTRVGFSELCVESDRTYQFVDDVVRQIAALTPGPYLHIGGDEAHTLSAGRYKAFMDRAQQIVVKHGKKVMAWHQLAPAGPVPGAVVEYWNQGKNDAAEVVAAARAGAKVVLAPADHVYLDMKYAGGEALGLNWAGTVDVEKSYRWEPATHLPGLPEESVLGVEAALWGETLRSVSDAEYLIFPRLLGVAEAAWSPREARVWEAFRTRWAAQLPRLDAAGITYAKRP